MIDGFKRIHLFPNIIYSSDKVLQRTQLSEIKDRVKFMNLAYLILLNDGISQAKELASRLLNDIYIVHVNQEGFHRNQGQSIHFRLSSKIIEVVQQYLQEKCQQFDINDRFTTMDNQFIKTIDWNMSR